MTPLVFISYCHSDEQYIDGLCKRFDEAGISYYIDRNKITWGSLVTDELLNALYECIALVVVVSKATSKSQWVPFEIGHVVGTCAMGANKKILPLLTDKTNSVPPYLVNHLRLSTLDEAVGYFQSENWKRHVQESKTWKSNELTRIKQELFSKLKKLEDQEREVDLLDQYKSGAKEPEEL